ncbi:MAG: DUF1800 domain-containing protein [Thermoanaerobaculales bacterium]
MMNHDNSRHQRHEQARRSAKQSIAEFLGSPPPPNHGRIGAFARRMRVTPLRNERPTATKVFNSPPGSPPTIAGLALNRAGFGPTPDDVATFRSLGSTPAERLEAWVDRQLEPNAIADAELATRLANSGYETLEKSLEQLWTEHQLEEEDFDYRMLPIWESQHAVILRATYSKRQLAEVLAGFWHNHFNVFGWHDFVGPVFVHYDRDVIRAHMLGNFRELLEAMTASPAMAFYLDNVFNSADGPNENFARELLELHALGEENYFGAIPATEVPRSDDGVPLGYVDEDVRALARCLTGWSLDENTGAFLFRSAWHDNGSKRVLGLEIPAGGNGIEDLRKVLDLLAVHSGVATFVCRKLCRWLVADNPTESLIQTAAQVFQDTTDEPDQLRRVVRTILLSNEFSTSWGDKVKRPFELVVSAVRSMNPDFTLPVNGEFGDLFVWLLFTTGNLPYYWGPPTGYPDQKQNWLTTNSLVSSWRLINFLTGFENSGFRPVDPVGGTPAGKRTAQELADYWIERVLLRQMDAPARQEIVSFMAQGTGLDVEVTTDFRRVLSEVLIRRLGNPELATVFPGYSGYQPLGIVNGEDLAPNPGGVVRRPAGRVSGGSP